MLLTSFAARLAAVAAMAVFMAAPAFAQSTPHLEYSSVSGSGSVITITRLPIQLPGGTFAYRDVTVTLSPMDDMGMLKPSARVVQHMSPTLKTSNIVPGLYASSINDNNEFLVSGPGPEGDGGEAKWTIVDQSGAPCGAPSEFYTGPLSGNPLYPRLQAAGLSSTEYSYGIVDAGTVCGQFPVNGLIGISQIGSQIEIVTFTSSKGTDQATPIYRYTYNFVK